MYQLKKLLIRIKFYFVTLTVFLIAYLVLFKIDFLKLSAYNNLVRKNSKNLKQTTHFNCQNILN